MRPPIRVTTATQLGASYTSPILTFLEGIVTEIDFNSVPVGTAIDTHYTAEGVTFQLISKTGAGSVVTLNTLSVADPNDPKGSASNVIGGFKDDQATIRATFKHPQIFVAIDARAQVVTTEFFDPAEAELETVFEYLRVAFRITSPQTTIACDDTLSADDSGP